MIWMAPGDFPSPVSRPIEHPLRGGSLDHHGRRPFDALGHVSLEAMSADRHCGDLTTPQTTVRRDERRLTAGALILELRRLEEIHERLGLARAERFEGGAEGGIDVRRITPFTPREPHVAARTTHAEQALDGPQDAAEHGDPREGDELDRDDAAQEVRAELDVDPAAAGEGERDGQRHPTERCFADNGAHERRRTYGDG